jgi:hypothetical protein
MEASKRRRRGWRGERRSTAVHIERLPKTDDASAGDEARRIVHGGAMARMTRDIGRDDTGSAGLGPVRE